MSTVQSIANPRRNRECRIVFFFFNDTATTEIYTLSLHDALPIWLQRVIGALVDDQHLIGIGRAFAAPGRGHDRVSFPAIGDAGGVAGETDARTVELDRRGARADIAAVVALGG